MTEEPTSATGVTQLELFFDLVFVFTITQLTQLLSVGVTVRRLWHALLILGVIFWMYDGYAWLTNAVPARGRKRRGLLLSGMACYLVLAIAVPHAFNGTGLTFGLAYLVITAIHAFLYVTGADEGSALAMRSLAPWNLAAAVIVLIGGAVGGTVQEISWTVVFLGLWFATRVDLKYEIEPAHFVERHGLLIIVAIGEAVVSTGVAARNEHVGVTLVLTAVLGLLLSAGFWWTYFGEDAGEMTVVERAFTAAGPDRPRMAFLGFGYAHFAMLAGIVLVAVGLKPAVADPDATLTTAHALVLCAGSATFLVAFAWFEVILGLRRWAPRDLLPLGAFVALPVATTISGLAGLAVACAVVNAVAWLESASGTRGPETTRAPAPAE